MSIYNSIVVVVLTLNNLYVRVYSDIDFNTINDDGSYRFRHTNDDIGGFYHSASASPDNIVRGRYGSRNPATGQIEETVYTAGPRGFRANGPKIHRKTDLAQYPPPSPRGSPDDPLADPYDDPSYSFSFRTLDHSRSEDSDASGRVRGLYSYLDDEGERHSVRYAAGAGTGFEVSNAVPDNPARVGYTSPLYKAHPKTRGKMTVQRGPGGSYKLIAAGPDHRRAESRAPDGLVRGTYSFLDDKGVQRTVEYVAGAGIGYRVVQNRIGPGTHINPSVSDFRLSDTDFKLANDFGRGAGGGLRLSDSAGSSSGGGSSGSGSSGSRSVGPTSGSRRVDSPGGGGTRGGNGYSNAADTGTRGGSLGTDGGSVTGSSFGNDGYRDGDESGGVDRSRGAGGDNSDTFRIDSTSGRGPSASHTETEGAYLKSTDTDTQRIDHDDSDDGSHFQSNNIDDESKPSTRQQVSGEARNRDSSHRKNDRLGPTSRPRGGMRYRSGGVKGTIDKIGDRQPMIDRTSNRIGGTSNGSNRKTIENGHRRGDKTRNRGNGYNYQRPNIGVSSSFSSSSSSSSPSSDNYNLNDDDVGGSLPPLITANRQILNIERERDWVEKHRDSTVIKNIGKWYIGLPPGQSVRAHVQNIDILPLGGRRVLSPSEALRQDEFADVAASLES